MLKFSMASFALAAIGLGALTAPVSAGPNLTQQTAVQPAVAAKQARGPKEKAAIAGVVRRQISAFRDRELTLAFSLAAPTVQVRFGNANRFFGFLAQNYSPVFSPESVFFDGQEESADGPVQRVLLTGPTGRQWLAQFTMVDLGAGQWRVADCKLTLAPGQIA